MIIGAFGFLVVFEAFVVLRSPIFELQSLKATSARLSAKLDREASSVAVLKQLTEDMDAADKALAGKLLRSDDAMLPFLFTTLDPIALRHGVSFGGVKPPVSRPQGSFEEVTFVIEATGNYRAMFDWLTDVLREVDPLVATYVSVKAIDEGQRVAFAVRLSGYRFASDAPSASGAPK